jgi:hypothetical protein
LFFRQDQRYAVGEERMSRKRRVRGSGSIYRQRGSRLWRAKFLGPDGRFVDVATGTPIQVEAEAFLKDRMAEVRLGSYAPRQGKVTVREIVEAKLSRDEANHARSIKDSKSRWRLHLCPFFGGMEASGLGSSHFDAYVAKRQAEGAGNATINRELALLRCAMNRAARKGGRSVPSPTSRCSRSPTPATGSLPTASIPPSPRRAMPRACGSGR